MARPEFNRVVEILADNIDTPFVKRIVDKENSPVLKNKDKTISTHSMMADIDEETGKWLVYPSVVEDGKGGLKRLERRRAMQRAKEQKDAIEFDSKDEALWFSENYKTVWDLE